MPLRGTRCSIKLNLLALGQINIRLEPVGHDVRVRCKSCSSMVSFLYELVLILQTHIFRCLARCRLYSNDVCAIRRTVRPADNMIFAISSCSRRLCEVEKILTREHSG